MPIMRTIRVLPFLVLAMTLRLCAAPMTDEDREHLLVHFEMTGHMLAEEVRGLSPAQLEYKASPDRWSIRECVSHLAVAEPDYWRDLQKAVKAPPDMKDKKSVATDADIMWYGIDRVVHTKTGGGHEKVDTYKNLGEARAKFEALHATMIAYINTTNDDLDFTFVVLAVADNGRATAIGYQRFPLKKGTVDFEIPFGETLAHGAYVVHVDGVGEIADI